MTEQTAAEAQMARLIVDALNLEHVTPVAIDPAAPLFGSGEASLGLDSIDALEIVLAVQKQHGVELRADDENVSNAFSSLRTLVRFVTERSGA